MGDVISELKSKIQVPREETEKLAREEEELKKLEENIEDPLDLDLDL